MPAPEPFSQFMARALYDPDMGYYTRQIRTVGARGDFSTSATMSPVFGQAVAEWLKGAAEEKPHIRDIIEVGAGSGDLMFTLRQQLGWWKRRQFRWHIVETSPVLQERQKARLGHAVIWHRKLEEALERTRGKAFIYHNELLDAFPVTLLQWQNNTWHEVHVTAEGQETYLPLDWPTEERQHYSALGPWAGRAAQQRVEVHASLRAWLQGWAPYWKEGNMLTVDYGDVFPALYYRRPAGTLRAYLLQQRIEGAAVLHHPGRQDITADVNFSDYRQWTQACGWKEVAYGTQTQFLQSQIKVIPTDAKTSFIASSGGAGEAFKHVIHRNDA